MGLISGVVSSLLSGSAEKNRTSQNSAGTYSGWSDEVQRAVENKFLQGLNQLDLSSSADLASLLGQRAQDYNIDVDAIMTEARRQAEMGTGQQYQRLARQAGSDANSLVAAAYNEALLAQEDNLGALRAELEAKNQEGQLNALAQALEGNNTANADILNLGNLLKGAQSTETQTGTMKNKNFKLGYSEQKQGTGQFGIF